MIIQEELFLHKLKTNSSKTRTRLNKLLPPASQSKISKAMRYAVLNGGKRLRAFLAIETSKIFDVPETRALQAAAAIECLHAYSLVHDDLPAMDNDDMRRGKPTVHKKWDDATAVLVGDGLQSLCYEILSNPNTHPDPNVRLDLIKSISKASGVNGMVGGQALDMDAENIKKPLLLEEVVKLQELKTGELIVWSAEVGARLAKERICPFSAYARSIGLAFQIRDDILDVIGEEQKTGKNTRKDYKAGKATFVSLLGLEQAKLKANQLVSDACDSISFFGEKSNMLKELAKFIIARSY